MVMHVDGHTQTDFLIVCHPETTANSTSRYVGRGDAPYTRLGEHQAPLLAAEIVAWKPDRAFSSPLRRAREVADAAASTLSLPLTIDERLTELHFGAAEGMTLPEIELAGLAFDFSSPRAPVALGGESRAEIFERSAEFADEQAALGGRVALVTHGGVLRSLLVHLLGIPLDAIWSFDIRPGQIAEVRRFEAHGSLVSFRRPMGEQPPGAADNLDLPPSG